MTPPQIQFFDETQPPEPPASANSLQRRVFMYDGQVFEDPGPDYSVQDILQALSETYPELTNGTWHSRTLPDDAAGAVEEITFVKVTGEKGSQANFFDTVDNVPQLPSPQQPHKRLFLYDGQVFEDPGNGYSTQDVLNFLAQTYPELTSGTWHSRTLPDQTEEITFVKVTGEKGGRDAG